MWIPLSVGNVNVGDNLNLIVKLKLTFSVVADVEG